jgi:hypothetical protein
MSYRLNTSGWWQRSVTSFWSSYKQSISWPAELATLQGRPSIRYLVSQSLKATVVWRRSSSAQWWWWRQRWWWWVGTGLQYFTLLLRLVLQYIKNTFQFTAPRCSSWERERERLVSILWNVLVCDAVGHIHLIPLLCGTDLNPLCVTLTFKNLASYIYRTGVPLPSRCCIIYIFFSTTVSTEYF